MFNQQPPEGQDPFAELRGDMIKLGYKPKEHPKLFAAVFDAERKSRSQLTAAVQRAIAWADKLVRRFKQRAVDAEQALAEYKVTVQEKIRILARLAAMDPLTKLLNKVEFTLKVTHFVALLAMEQRETEVRDEWAALWIVDIDSFKDINDRYGHLQGDTVLETTADILRSTIRTHRSYASGQVVEIGFLSRFGGDEFAALETSVANWTDSYNVAGLVKRKFMSQKWAELNSRMESVGMLTLSIGVVMFRVSSLYGLGSGQASGIVADLIHIGDLGMYEAKRIGLPVWIDGIEWDRKQGKWVRVELEGGGPSIRPVLSRAVNQ